MLKGQFTKSYRKTYIFTSSVIYASIYSYVHPNTIDELNVIFRTHGLKYYMFKCDVIQSYQK